MKLMKKVTAFIMAAAAVALMMPFNAYAAPVIDYSQIGEATIIMLAPGTGEPIPGVRFTAFRVGEFDSSTLALTFKPTGDFQDSGVSFLNMSASQSKVTAKQLADYVGANGITGKAGITESDGKSIFTPLVFGLYLVITDAFAANSKYITPSPFLFAVPITDTAGTKWIYEVNVYPKTETKPTEPETTTTTITTTAASTIPVTTQPATTHGGLPQTGVLRWPIPILSVAGILLFSFGWADIYVKRKKRDE